MCSIKFTVTTTITTAAAATTTTTSAVTATDYNDCNEKIRNGTFRSNF